MYPCLRSCFCVYVGVSVMFFFKTKMECEEKIGGLGTTSVLRESSKIFWLEACFCLKLSLEYDAVGQKPSIEIMFTEHTY